MPPLPRHTTTLTFGEHRIRGGWVGIVVAGAALAIIGASHVVIGSWAPLLAVGPICLAFAAVCATTRTVAIDIAAREVRVNRRLLGLSWTRTWPIRAFDRVAVVWSFYLSKHAYRDGTLLGDQRFMHYRIMLAGRRRVPFEHIVADPDRAEAIARQVAGALLLPAERHGYGREQVGERLAVQREGVRERFG